MEYLKIFYILSYDNVEEIVKFFIFIRKIITIDVYSLLFTTNLNF